MQTKSKFIAALIAAAFAATTLAQQPGVSEKTSIASEPGKAAGVRKVQISAQVVSIDKATRTLTLKGPKGNVFDVVAGEEVKNFDQITVGDLVVARYLEALTLELKKSPAAGTGDVSVREGAGKAKQGERPAVAGARQIALVAEVTGVDPRNSTITLKGPKGNEVTLSVRNPDQFKVVKKGDKVDVTYTEALALSVEPAAKSAADKKK